MKKIKLIFIGLGYNSYNQTNITIYQGNKKIFEGRTYNNEIELCLEENNAYIIKTNSTYFNFYVDKNDTYYFSFLNPIRTITFILIDSYNYPIERGEIILWQNQ